jgi:hypothetical protein
MMALTLIALALAQTTTPPPIITDAPAASPAQRGADVAGAWTVDLRTEDDAAPYSQPMHLVIAADGTISGDFYNSTISSGRYGRNRGRSCVAFVTSDGAGDYQHAACLVDGRMIGQSWAEHRQFVLPWAADRVATPQ